MAIKAAELMLGNWVYMDGVPVDIVHLTPGEVSLDPIPLTPDILERAGFVSTGGGDDFHRSGILWDKKGCTYQYYHAGDGGFFVENGEYYGHFCDIGDVTYLHQLQNLYFALTGEQLEIKWLALARDQIENVDAAFLNALSEGKVRVSPFEDPEAGKQA